MHHSAHHAANWIYLIVLPLVIWLRLSRARRAAQASDFWFEAEGDHFIYHPFGRFGAAYLVPPATRSAIRARMGRFTRVAALIFLAAAAGPIILRSTDPDTYMQYAPMVLPIRLGMVVAIIVGGLVWRLLAIRPLYRGLPPAPRRISTQSIRAKQAAARSWWGILLSNAVMLAAAGLLIYLAVTRGGVFVLYAVLLGLLAALNARALFFKWKHRRA
jgi:hypothetical protein